MHLFAFFSTIKSNKLFFPKLPSIACCANLNWPFVVIVVVVVVVVKSKILRDGRGSEARPDGLCAWLSPVRGLFGGHNQNHCNSSFRPTSRQTFEIRNGTRNKKNSKKRTSFPTVTRVSLEVSSVAITRRTVTMIGRKKKKF